MLKKYVLTAVAAGLLLAPVGAFAKMGSGQMSAKSKDIDVEFFGSVKAYPHFMTDVNFNSDAGDGRILDENGWMSNHSVRNEARIGWKGTGENWSFLVTLESDFNLNKANGDRGNDATSPASSGMTGNSFGLEKLDMRYNFGSVEISTGWNGRFLDINSGGLLYGDDHPFIGLTGKISDTMSWEALYIMVQDDIDGSIGAYDADELDWRVYSLRGAIDLSGLTLAPIYAYSDNNDHNAQVHYFGVEGYGKIGIITPRFEIIYATGDMDEDSHKTPVISEDYDIEGWAAYGSVEFDLGKAFNPYVGVSWLSGDDDANDSDIEAFNGITNISRYTATFGMENALIYRYVPGLGSHLYSNNFNVLGSADGYGGIGNSSKADAPGLLMIGAGAKGQLTDELSYKAQLMYFQMDETGALEDNYGHDIDEEMGWELDAQLTYKFSNHFSLGNTLSIFDPGDGVEDLHGSDYDDTAICDTVEMIWKF